MQELLSGIKVKLSEQVRQLFGRSPSQVAQVLSQTTHSLTEVKNAGELQPRHWLGLGPVHPLQEESHKMHSY
jgi:hypothetical protein